MSTELVAKVVVSSANFAIDRPYDYRIPELLREKALAGVRVIVPFSRGNRRTEGIIVALSNAKEKMRLKNIDKVLDESPVLSENQVKLALWMRDRFFCTVYDAVRAMLPAGLWFKNEYSYKAFEGISVENALQAAEAVPSGQEIIKVIFGSEGGVSLNELKKIPEVSDLENSLKSLVKLGLISELVSERRRVKDKTVGTAYLEVPAEEAAALSSQRAKKSPIQAEVLRLLSAIGSAPVKDICYFTGASSQTIKRLEREGLIKIEFEEAFRRPEIKDTGKIEVGELSAEQQAAFDGIASLLDKTPSAALLYGVTGSGKTAVYIKLIREVINRGRSAIVLVPEIALTPQLVSTFSHCFGDGVAVLHSSLGIGERYDEWKRIRSGCVNVVVGTRSAVFAPLDNIGLIILDEEQEYTYKSENNPRYHARDVAKYRCVQSGALLLLGSATPSIDTMYNAKTGRYSLFTLNSRFNTQALPEVLIVDMKRELRQGNGSTISSVLKTEIDENLEKGEQTILFINRRGASSFMACPECGFTYGCPNCSVSLTYHSANKRLMCHYCGHSEPARESCPECGGIMKYFGAGTQKVEEELHEIFPGVKILRMDTDTVSASATHDSLLGRFAKERIPILIGTQMVAKGLNFSNVTLVGVISADQSLYTGDYRAEERTFSLITQVVGRSGRGDKKGRAVIQTFTPQNEVIRLASKQDYSAFYEREIAVRRILGTPPIAEFFAITVSGLDESAVLRCCIEIKRVLCDAIGDNRSGRILGPAPAAVLRISQRYRYRLLLSAENTKAVRTLIANIVIRYLQDSRFRGLSIFADIDPMD